jgi:hypothetical protein
MTHVNYVAQIVQTAQVPGTQVIITISEMINGHWNVMTTRQAGIFENARNIDFRSNEEDNARACANSLWMTAVAKRDALV